MSRNEVLGQSKAFHLAPIPDLLARALVLSRTFREGQLNVVLNPQCDQQYVIRLSAMKSHSTADDVPLAKIVTARSKALNCLSTAGFALATP